MKALLPAAVLTALSACTATTHTAPSGDHTPDRAHAQDPPNLIVILVDDLGYADTGFNGTTDLATPHLDQLAAQGVVCTNAYVTYAVCGPSRAGLITGRYQDRFGANLNPTANPAVPNNGVPTSEQNIAELLAPVGYTSAAVGKWHLGTHPDLRPLERGFDHFFGFLAGGLDYFPENLTLHDLSEVNGAWAWHRTKLVRGDTPIENNTWRTDYLTEELSAEADAFLRDHHTTNPDDPFFLYLAYNAPHTPMQARQRDLDRFPHITDNRRKTYAAMVATVDDGVGMLLDTLNELDLDEDTLIVFLSDNGGATNNGSINAPLRGHKSDFFDGGLRVPFVVRWPGVLPAGTRYDHPVSALDIAATIVDLADAPVAPERPLDGVNLVPYLTGDNTDRPHEALYWYMIERGRLAARIGDLKFIQLEDGTPPMLFDLAADVGEATNLHNARPDDTATLRDRFDVWAEPMVLPLAPGLGTWFPN